MIKFYTTKLYKWSEIGTFNGDFIIKHRCPICNYDNPWHGEGVKIAFLKREGDKTTCDKCYAIHYLYRDGLTLFKREVIEALVAPADAELV